LNYIKTLKDREFNKDGRSMKQLNPCS